MGRQIKNKAAKKTKVSVPVEKAEKKTVKKETVAEKKATKIDKKVAKKEAKEDKKKIKARAVKEKKVSKHNERSSLT